MEILIGSKIKLKRDHIHKKTMPLDIKKKKKRRHIKVQNNNYRFTNWLCQKAIITWLGEQVSPLVLL